MQQILLKYIYDYSFQFMNIDYMNKINYIIKNSYFADVKDNQLERYKCIYEVC